MTYYGLLRHQRRVYFLFSQINFCLLKDGGEGGDSSCPCGIWTRCLMTGRHKVVMTPPPPAQPPPSSLLPTGGRGWWRRLMKAKSDSAQETQDTFSICEGFLVVFVSLLNTLGLHVGYGHTLWIWRLFLSCFSLFVFVIYFFFWVKMHLKVNKTKHTAHAQTSVSNCFPVVAWRFLS